MSRIRQCLGVNAALAVIVCVVRSAKQFRLQCTLESFSVSFNIHIYKSNYAVSNSNYFVRLDALVAQPYWYNIEPIFNQYGILRIYWPRYNDFILTSCQYRKVVYSRYLAN